MGIKAGDETSAGLCSICHAKLDQPSWRDARAKDERREYEHEMNLRTLRWLLTRGHLLVSNHY